MDRFADLGLSEQILENLKAKGYENPTEVQAQALPIVLEKKDLVIQSQTGSGKTAAFGLPLIHGVMTDVPAVQYLVLVPTRELAAQVREELAELSKDTGVLTCAIYGGADMQKQIKALKNGAQIVIGTPGRILDHLKRRTMSFSVVRGVVLDEADKMLSMGFLPDVQLIFRHLPKRRQMVMSSATFPFTVEQLIHQYMCEPEKLLLSSDDVAPKEIEHLYCILQNEDKETVLLALLEKEQPEMSLIFCNTKVDVKSVNYFLSKAGLKVEALSSELTQSQRERVLRKLKTGQIQHLVCTDLAARGIDIPALSHVFHYSASGDNETYVHRSGRTGRAGRSGKAVSLVSSLDLSGFLSALRQNGLEAKEIPPPTEEEITEARTEKHYQHLELIDFGRDADVREDFLRLAKKLTSKQIQSCLPLLLEHFSRPEMIMVVEPPVQSEDEGQAPPQYESRDSRGPRQPRRQYGGGGRRNDSRRGDPRRDDPRRSDPRRSDPRRGRGGPPQGGPRDNRGRDGGGQRYPRGDEGDAHGRRRKSFTTVCVALGRLDGLDEMDLQNILCRQGRARMDDIGQINMKDHESFVNIAEGSLNGVLAADGKHYKSFELFVSKSPTALDSK